MASRTLAPRARSAAGSRSKTRVACRDSSTDGAAASVADARSGQLAVRVRTTLIVLLAVVTPLVLCSERDIRPVPGL